MKRVLAVVGLLAAATCGVGVVPAHAASDSLEAFAWGSNDYGPTNGPIGNGTTTNSDIPVALDSSGALAGKTAVQVSAGFQHACAVTSDGHAFCWGLNLNGQLGNGTTTNSESPVAVNTSGALSGKTITEISAGGDHTCAITSDGKAYCWGWNSNGQLGNDTTTSSNVPVAVDTTGVLSGKTITHISAGGSHTCAIASDGAAYCWGTGLIGRLGNNDSSDSHVPVAVAAGGALSGKSIVEVSSGSDFSCALDSNGKAYCWGGNFELQLGGQATSWASHPVAVFTNGVLNGKTITHISAGYHHTCVVTTDGGAYCWGRNSEGELGNGGTTNSQIPLAVDTSGVLNGKTITHISAGYHHTCVLDSNGKAYCWGANDLGQLGNGTTTSSNVPVAVDTTGALNGLTLTQISAGTEFTIALSAVELPPTGADTNGFVAVAGVFLAAGAVLVTANRGRRVAA